MSSRAWSEKDLVNKWKRKLSDGTARSLPWDVLKKLVSGLSDDTKLPREFLLEIIRSRDISGLFSVASNLDVTVYTSADLLLQDRLVVELFSKFDFADSPFNKREKAKLRFFEAEERCREANFRVQHSLGMTNSINGVIHRAIRHVDRILGNFDLNQVLRYARFGPGATLCVKGPFTTEYFKLCGKNPTVSSETLPLAEALLKYDPQWMAYLIGIHPFDVSGPFSPLKDAKVEYSAADYNKVAFVPKNAKTERSIAIEPYFNVYFQLGVGGMIRERLYRRCGLNLDTQERNQQLALRGSLDNSLATIDFSMASDTISRETVRLLLPPDWFSILDRLRSKNYLMEDSIRPYQKFSSMGNGFTFELESLIFYAVALASCECLNIETKDITVFGDDVVLPVGGCKLFIEVCNYLGFKVNEDKSFLDGRFRESCGEDFLNGQRVRPVFCKELSTTQHCVSLANRLSELNRSVGFGSRLNGMLADVVDLLLSRIPRDVRRLVVGPPSEDYDGYIHTTCVAALAASPLVKWTPSVYAWRHPVIRFKPKKLQRRDDAAALWVIWGTASRQTPIPKPPPNTEWLNKLPVPRRYIGDSEMSFREAVPREITGRQVGTLSLGHSYVWTLHQDCSVRSGRDVENVALPVWFPEVVTNNP